MHDALIEIESDNFNSILNVAALRTQLRANTVTVTPINPLPSINPLPITWDSNR